MRKGYFMSPKSGAAQGRVIRIERKGPYIVLPRINPRIREIVQNNLRYTYLKFEKRGRDSKVIPIPTDCFMEVNDPDKVIPPHIITGAGYLPRLRKAFRECGYSVSYKNLTKIRKKAHKVLWSRFPTEAQLRYRQGACLRAVLNNPYGRIHCPTGYGKSWMIGQLAKLLPYARIDITTHSRDVIEMIYAELCSMLPSVGIVHGSKKEWGHRVMCYSGKSLHHSDGKADFLFVDELHEFGTTDYLDKVSGYDRSRNYGFSANLPGDRPDGADFEIEGSFGPVRFTMPYDEAVAHGCIVQIKVMWVDVVMDVNPCEDASDSTMRNRWGIWRNQVRNEKIAAVANHFLEKGKQVLVLVDTVDHACFLKKLLPDFEMVYGEGNLKGPDRSKYIKWGLIEPDEPIMTTERRFELKHSFEEGSLRAAIATGVWNRGVNFKQLQVLIRGDAKTSAIADTQLPGRLARIDEDKDYGLLVDFHDQFDSVMQRRAQERKRRYAKMRWDQIEDHSRDEDNTRYRQGQLFTG